MAHFYGEIQGNRGAATRAGSKNSGFKAHIRGWNIGVRIHCDVDYDGNDVIHVYKTSGSNGSKSDVRIATITEEI
jgi:hypothetical protein